MKLVVSPAPSDASSFTEIEAEISTDLLVLDSLFPVVKILPSLIKENNSGHYYIRGTIEPSDLETLYNYAGRVGELTLGAEPDSESRLAPHVLARIARLQDPNKPLFPLLHHLRIVATSPSLHFFDLLLSSSLATLELTSIPVDDPFYTSVLSFLECAVEEAPNLSTLILGPGRIQDQILHISLGFKNLRCLKLLDVEISITDQLMRDIGSLQHLETFVLRDNGKSTYTRPAPSFLNEPFIDETPLTSQDQESLAAADGRDVDFTPISDDDRQIHAALFSALRTLEVDGTFDLIEELVAKISSTILRVLSIDITKALERVGETYHAQPFGYSDPLQRPTGFGSTTSTGFGSTTSTGFGSTGSGSTTSTGSGSTTATGFGSTTATDFGSTTATGFGSTGFGSTTSTGSGSTTATGFGSTTATDFGSTTATGFGSTGFGSTTSTCFGSTTATGFGSTAFGSTTSTCFGSTTATGFVSTGFGSTGFGSTVGSFGYVPPPSLPRLSTADIVTLLRRSIQKWPNTLVSVNFNLKDDSPMSFLLPSDVFEDLLLRPDMKHLKITGMGIDSMDDILRCFREVGDSKFEVLHLPVHSTAIPSARLREIAVACSHLKSLRCRVCIRDSSDILASSPLSHELEELSVSKEGGNLDQGMMLGVARYLDSIFPRLESIMTHDGNNTEQWGFVFDLVKSYQAVRMDERQRLGGGEGIGSNVPS